MRNNPDWSHLITCIENELAEFYGFSLATRAMDHLITAEELKNQSAIHNLIEDVSHRGNVIAIHKPQEDLFIGVHIHEQVASDLISNNPFKKLTHANLDAYCVLVEEISHFHLLINRALGGRSVSHLELEYQGEIDKVLSSAIRLRQQNKDAHYWSLTKKIFEDCVWLSASSEQMYQSASKCADGIYDPIHSKNLQKILRSLYHFGWQEKFDFVENSKVA